MNIGIDARVVTDKNSGLVDYVINLIKELIRNPQISLYVFGQKKYESVFSSIKEKSNLYLIPVYFSNNFLSLKDFIYEQTGFPKIVNQYQLDIFHNPFGFGIPLFLKHKLLLTIHDLIPLYDYDNLSTMQKILYRLSLNISVKKADHIVTISNFTQNDLIKFFPGISPEKLTTIHNGFDNLSQVKNISKVFRNLQAEHSLNEKYILYIGSATKRKNLLRMVTAFINLKCIFNFRHKLVLVSKFDRLETLKTYHQIKHIAGNHKMDDEIIYTGYVEQEEKAALIKNCDFFIYPSLYEGFGLPILEAMCFNKPVLCSNLKVFKELYNHQVKYFNPQSVTSIEKALSEMITKPQPNNQAGISMNEITNNFSWKKMSDQYLRLYKRIISL